MTAALEWLEIRLGEVPDELDQAIRAVVAGHPQRQDEGVGQALARAALAELDSVVTREPTRAVALSLLAADATLTYAFEAAAELGEDARALADRVGPFGLLGGRLSQTGGTE
jgi:hypothetical protein